MSPVTTPLFRKQWMKKLFSATGKAIPGGFLKQSSPTRNNREHLRPVMPEADLIAQGLRISIINFHKT